MSESYFCIFCDTIILALDQLSDHLSQHLAKEEGDDYNSLSDIERQFVDNFVEYEKQLSLSMSLMPKELPKDNIKTLLIGCPACDSLIRCYDLIPNRENKHECLCGQQLDKPLVKCIQCQQSNHFDCGFKSGYDKCINCMSKIFKTSYLKCLPFEAQRDHCYQHLAYYPFVCQYKDETDGDICGKQLITTDACERHLTIDHKFYLNDKNKDNCDVLSLYFDYNLIDKIDELIITRLNSKSNINIRGVVVNESDLSPIIERNDFLSKIGLKNESIRKKIDFNIDSDSEIETSFHYTSEEFRSNPNNRLSKSSTSCVKRKHQSDHSLDYIQLPKSVPKRRGRPAKNRFLETGLTLSQMSVAMEDEIFEPEEVVDLTHRRQYINWFTQTKPTKFPYFPQKDDDVYYLPYGHQLYKDEVQSRGLYCQSNMNYTIRFFKYDKILAKVAKIDFLFKERRKTQTVIRCIYITLRPYDEKYGTIIHVKYHDMDGVLDFIVLKEHYENSVQKLWSIGEEFRSIIDDKYWFGVVIGYNKADYCKNTLFRKIQIKWHSNDAIDFLSPWDLDPIDNSQQFNRYSFVSINDEDRRSFFSRRSEEWPDFNEDKELKRVAKGLKVIYKMDKTTEFPLLQDLTDSRYREKILYPVDMKTFITRIENHYYRRHLAIKYDIKFMESNIRKLIKSVKRDPEYRFDEMIAKRLKYNTKFVTALSLLFIDTLDCKNPYDLYPHIDDYLETHDVKCYSVKRVHLNSRKKYPNSLPVAHKRLPKTRPQSIGDSLKTLKIFKALSNTETLNRSIAQAFHTNNCSSTPKKKARIETISKPLPQPEIISPIKKSEELIVPDPDNSYCLDTTKDNSSVEHNYGYSSDVSRSEFEYQLECSETLSDSDKDPDFKTTNYYKNKF